MERAVFVYTTYPSIVEAEAAGRALVERRLCACVNILPGMVSLYWWQGAIERGDEVVMIIKTRAAQAFDILSRTFRRILGQLDHIIEHHAILLRNRRRLVVTLQRRNHFFIQRHPAQKLCVRLDSIHAPVRHRNHGRNHLVLRPV